MPMDILLPETMSNHTEMRSNPSSTFRVPLPFESSEEPSMSYIIPLIASRISGHQLPSISEVYTWLSKQEKTLIPILITRIEDGVKHEMKMARELDSCWQDFKQLCVVNTSEPQLSLQQPPSSSINQPPPTRSIAPTMKVSNFLAELADAHDQKDTGKLLNVLHKPGAQDEIILNCHGSTQYMLLPCLDFFIYPTEYNGEDQSDDEEDDRTKKESDTDPARPTYPYPSPYYRLKHGDRNSFITADLAGGKVKVEWTKDGGGDEFLALGFMTESSNGVKRCTKYLYALNVSTKPVSLWLIFDYSDPRDGEFGHSSTHSFQTPDQKHVYGAPIFNTCYGQPSFTDETESVEEARESGQGYMGQGKPWDIALLYKDVQKVPSNLVENDFQAFPEIQTTDLRAINISFPEEK